MPKTYFNKEKNNHFWTCDDEKCGYDDVVYISYDSLAIAGNPTCPVCGNAMTQITNKINNS